MRKPIEDIIVFLNHVNRNGITNQRAIGVPLGAEDGMVWIKAQKYKHCNKLMKCLILKEFSVHLQIIFKTLDH